MIFVNVYLCEVCTYTTHACLVIMNNLIGSKQKLSVILFTVCLSPL